MGEGAEDVPTSEDYDICIQTYQEFDKDILGNYINSNFNYNYNLSTEATRYYEGGKCSNLSEFSYTINNEYFHERPIKELIASLFFGEDENTFSVFLDGSIDSEVSWMIEKHQKRSLIKRLRNDRDRLDPDNETLTPAVKRVTDEIDYFLKIITDINKEGNIEKFSEFIVKPDNLDNYGKS